MKKGILSQKENIKRPSYEDPCGCPAEDHDQVGPQKVKNAVMDAFYTRFPKLWEYLEQEEAKMILMGTPGTAFDRQVGGDHYKQYAIQPYEFFYRNGIPHHKAAIIRRILRFDHPTGKGMEDLDKIIHEIQLIKELWGEDKS